MEYRRLGKAGVKVSADKATNSVVITSSLRDYAQLRAVVDRLDLPRRQVFIDAVVLDLSVNGTNSFGVSFHGADTAPTGSYGNSLLSCGTIMGVIGLIEGIIYLTRTDEQFVATYVNGKKEWF